MLTAVLDWFNPKGPENPIKIQLIQGFIPVHSFTVETELQVKTNTLRYKKREYKFQNKGLPIKPNKIRVFNPLSKGPRYADADFPLNDWIHHNDWVTIDWSDVLSTILEIEL